MSIYEAKADELVDVVWSKKLMSTTIPNLVLFLEMFKE